MPSISSSNTQLFAFHDSTRAAGLPDQPAKTEIKIEPQK